MKDARGTRRSRKGVQVILYTAVSIDGRIGYRGEKFQLGRCEKDFLHRLRAESDAVVVGAGTVISDDPLLTARPRGRSIKKQPIRVVLDGRLSTPPSARIYDVSVAPTLVLTTSAAPMDKVARLRSRGVEVEVLPGREGFIEPSTIVRRLSERGLRKILVEGGSMVITSFIKAGIYDALMVAYTPWILGARGVPYFSEPLGEAVRLKLLYMYTCPEDEFIAVYGKYAPRSEDEAVFTIYPL